MFAHETLVTVIICQPGDCFTTASDEMTQKLISVQNVSVEVKNSSCCITRANWQVVDGWRALERPDVEF